MQLAEIVERLALAPPDTHWLTRCLECNTALEPRVKEAVRALVPPRVFATQSNFVGCPSCGRVFWPGSHFNRMWERLARLVGRPGDNSSEEVSEDRDRPRRHDRHGAEGPASPSAGDAPCHAARVSDRLLRRDHPDEPSGR